MIFAALNSLSFIYSPKQQLKREHYQSIGVGDQVLFPEVKVLVGWPIYLQHIISVNFPGS